MDEQAYTEQTILHVHLSLAGKDANSLLSALREADSWKSPARSSAALEFAEAAAFGFILGGLLLHAFSRN